MRVKPKHLLFLGYPLLGYVIWDFIRNGLHPDDRRKKNKVT